MERAEYDRIEAVNFSTLKLMAKSPAHYHENLLRGREDTNAMKLGRACHLAVFEPERFRSQVARWEGGVRRGKDFDVFCSEHKGQDILTEAEHDMCLAIGQAVRADAIAKPYVTGGKGEVTLRWKHKREQMGELAGYELACKGRVDFIANAAGGCIADLKTTADASPDKFGRQAFDLAYHAQAAFYTDGAEKDLGKRYPYFIIAAEKKAPWAVQVYEVPDDQLELGRALYLGWLDQLVMCREQSAWPAYSTGVLPLQMPRWAIPDEESDLADMGLKSAGGDE